MDNEVSDCTPQKINLMIVVNSKAFLPENTIFPAVQAFAKRPEIGKIALVDMQDNSGLFEDFDPAHAALLNVRLLDENYSYETMENYHLHKVDPAEFHVGWYRMDTPAGYHLGKLFGLMKIHFDMPFFNSLDGMLEYGSKAKLHDLQDDLISSDGHRYIPASQICGCPTSIKMFQKQLEKEVVIKSFFGCGGKEVHLLSDFEGDKALKEFIATSGGEVYVQEFVRMGRVIDDRIILMFDPDTGDMEAKCGLRRIAQKGEWKANMSLGATGELLEIDDRHREMARVLGPSLIEQGIYLAGVDVLYDEDVLDQDGNAMPRITEINVRNVGGVAEATEATGINYIQDLLDGLCYLFQNHSLREGVADSMLEMVEEEVDYSETDVTEH